MMFVEMEDTFSLSLSYVKICRDLPIYLCLRRFLAICKHTSLWLAKKLAKWFSAGGQNAQDSSQHEFSCCRPCSGRTELRTRDRWVPSLKYWEFVRIIYFCENDVVVKNFSEAQPFSNEKYVNFTYLHCHLFSKMFLKRRSYIWSKIGLYKFYWFFCEMKACFIHFLKTT